MARRADFTGSSRQPAAAAATAGPGGAIAVPDRRWQRHVGCPGRDTAAGRRAGRDHLVGVEFAATDVVTATGPSAALCVYIKVAFRA